MSGQIRQMPDASRKGDPEVPMPEKVMFTFRTPEGGIEDDIALAIFASECVHGRPKARLDVTYLIAADMGNCVFDVRGPAGEMAVRVFLGLCCARFGDAGFKVDRSGDAGGKR